jgi:hypothetical protein
VLSVSFNFIRHCASQKIKATSFLVKKTSIFKSFQLKNTSLKFTKHQQISQSTQKIQKGAQKLKIKPSLIYLSLLKSIFLGNVNVLKNHHPTELST